MALVLLDRAQESATANTTVSFTLTGAQTGYQSLAGVGDTNTTYYGATDGTNWEVGIGTYSTTGPTLTRTTILSSSNAGSAVSAFTSPLTVWVDYTASKAVTTDTLAYPPVIGGTTPAAGTFTTITGQTEVLRGTGQNLIINSQVFTSGWNLNNLSATSNTTTAPDSTNTGSTLTASAGTSILHQAYQGTYAYLTSSSVVFSIYAKAGTNNFLAITVGNSNGFYANFNLSNGTVGQSAALGTGTLTSATATSVGNGWYRLVIIGKTVDAPYALFSMSNAATYSADGLGRQTWTSAGTETVFIWGAQFEYGTAVSSYQVTTSALVFNQPSLSFNNAAQIGMEYNGNLYLQPAGTGALQAQKTDSTATGGNARGANAVDWQTVRSGATQVASGTSANINGGQQNTASGFWDTVGGGYNNFNNGFGSVISGGYGNNAGGNYTVVAGGKTNTAGSSAVITYSTVLGGSTNTSSGYFNLIGGGYTNSGTSASAVTTQSATMNATTAVTLSGSNASIKVGQYITGTSIAEHTYVAAISGTSLTLSQAASGSSTSTLSFYTPHGVVVGGGNNQATGAYSFIGGGGDAGTAANRNVASGDWSVVCGGIKNTASGKSSFVGGGGTDGTNVFSNTASGISSAIVGGTNNITSNTGDFIGGGFSNNASGSKSFIGAGDSNVTNSYASVIAGGYQGTTRGIKTNYVITNSLLGTGQSQSSFLIISKQTTDATPTVLVADGSAAGTTNQVILPNNSAYYFKGSVISNVTGAANGAAWDFSGAIMRGANAASTVLIGTPQLNRVAASAGATTWTIAITADTTNGGLAITVTGVAGTTIRWVAKLETTEVTY